MTMTKKEFKRRWELNSEGDGLTFNDVADCAQEWGLYATPRIHPIDKVTKAVLRAAGVKEGN